MNDITALPEEQAEKPKTELSAEKYVIGNWKMYAPHDKAIQLAHDTATGLQDIMAASSEAGKKAVQTVICPPFTQIAPVSDILKETKIPPALLSLGAQDCYPAQQGPFTGDVSAYMLNLLGVKYVILGHSERRHNHNETDEEIHQKVKAATAAGLIPIVCIGEHLTERNEGRAASVLARQLEGALSRNFRGMVAYEPVWAIGSGITPSNEELNRKGNLIRALLSMRLMTNDFCVPLLYGGSVTGQKAPAILATRHFDGVLVGNASLEAKGFLDIVRVALAPYNQPDHQEGTSFSV